MGEEDEGYEYLGGMSGMPGGASFRRRAPMEPQKVEVRALPSACLLRGG